MHLEPEVVALAGSFAHAGEDREAAVDRRDAGDQLGKDDGLAQPGASEQADLAASHERRQKVDDLDPGLELLGLGREVVEARRVAMDRPSFVRGDGAAAVDRLAQKIEHAAQRFLANRHADRPAVVRHGHAAHQAVG